MFTAKVRVERFFNDLGLAKVIIGSLVLFSPLVFSVHEPTLGRLGTLKIKNYFMKVDLTLQYGSLVPFVSFTTKFAPDKTVMSIMHFLNGFIVGLVSWELSSTNSTFAVSAIVYFWSGL